METNGIRQEFEEQLDSYRPAGLNDEYNSYRNTRISVKQEILGSDNESKITLDEEQQNVKRRRLTTSQKKYMRRLLADNLPYDLALEKVLSRPSCTTINTTKKRISSHNSTPETNKKAKPNGALNEEMIKVGIVCEDFPYGNLDTIQQKAVENAIINELHKITENGPQIRFLGCSYKPGWLTVNCADENTKDWLAKTVCDITPWKNAKLRLVEGEDLPKPCVVTAYFPDSTYNTKEVLKLLRLQNKSLPTEEWKVLRKVSKPQGLALTISMDEYSVSILRDLDFKPFYKFNRVQFRIQKGPNEFLHG